MSITTQHILQHPRDMDSKTTLPTTPDPLTAMFQNATIDKAEKNEFSSTARDTINVTVNNYSLGEGESSDVIDCLRTAVPLLVAEVRKNDRSRSTVGDTTSADGSDQVSQAVTTDHPVDGDPVDVIDLVPSEPSSLRVASVADRYTRSMLKCFAGYALYEPQPLSELSMEYLRHGINVGDVGFVRGDGVFDFLFSICPSKNGLINPPTLPDGFSLESPEHSATRTARALPRKTRLFQSPIARTKSGEYICEGSEGAILELPEGAIEDEAMNIRPFSKLAARHGVQWYEYAMTRGREIQNGSLYLITSFTKCAQWGIAVFDRPCVLGQGLRFDKKRSLPFGKSTSKYHWKGSHTFRTKISSLDQGDAPNQCVFLRGYKIMIRQDIFDNLCGSGIPSSSSRAGSISLTRQQATRIRGGGGSDLKSERLTGGDSSSWTTMSNMTKSGEVVLHANFNSSLVHPSDLVNAALLNQNLGAKVALTHDDVWCYILKDNFPKLNYAMLINIARSYTNIVDEYDCVSLEKISDSSNILKESHLVPRQGIETSALQGSLTKNNTATISLSMWRSSPALPATVWSIIASFLPPEELRNLYSVNKPLFDLSMGERYRKVRFNGDKRTMEWLQKHIVRKHVRGYVRTIEIKPWQIKEREAAKTIKKIGDAVKELPNVREYTVQCPEDNGHPGLVYGLLPCLTNWKDSLVKLTLHVPPDSLLCLAPVTLNKLESLELVFWAKAPESFQYQVIEPLAVFINNLYPTLESLSVVVTREATNVNLAPLFKAFDTFPHLNHFDLSMPFDGSSFSTTWPLLSFVDKHKGLRSLELSSKPAPTRQSPTQPEHKEWILQILDLLDNSFRDIQYVNVALRPLKAGSILDALVRFLSIHGHSLTSLALTENPGLSSEEVQAILGATRNFYHLGRLALNVQRLSEELFTLLAQRFPRLEHLEIGIMYPPLSLHILWEDLNNSRQFYLDWGLKRIEISCRLSLDQMEPLLKDCIPSLEVVACSTLQVK